MKVLHCIATMEGGGAERQLSLLSRGLVAEGCEVHVALLRGGANLEALKNSGAIIHRLSCRSSYDPRIFFQLLRLMRRIGPDVVQVWLPQMEIVGGLAALAARVALVTTERSSAAHYSAGDWQIRLRGFVAGRAALVIANSQAGKDYWRERLGDDSRIRVIRNIVPVSEIAASPKADPQTLGLASDAELIVFAGRFEPVKNIEHLIPALRLALEQRPKAVALLFGEGSLKPDVKRMIERDAAGGRIRVMDYATDLWSWLRAAQVFVSISYAEGQPNAVFEAVACGCPTVLSDIAPHRELLGEDSAYLVAPKAPEEIARAIVRCLTTPDEAAVKARRAFEKVTDFSTETVAREYSRQYQQVLSQKYA
ncbi:MAG TPA: glycosyltransferase [Blastocatellia bacterium]|nr:glycosyltransferase [Blastocatellia bacterium]